MLARTFAEKMDDFIARLDKENKAFKDWFWQWDKTGKKYFRVLQDAVGQKSSRYFVEKETGTIFACEGWKKPNLNRSYGTLDTIDQFDWSGFNGVAKPDSEYVMRGTAGGYQTAIHRYTFIP